MKNSGTVIVLVALLALFACARAPAHANPSDHLLSTVSSQYALTFAHGFYRGRIDYEYANRSAGIVSVPGCHGPYPPRLEKRVGQSWVFVYAPIMLMCEDVPPFRVRPGDTYRGILAISAGRRGGRYSPEFQADSVPGTYRLRWDLRTGPDPVAADAREIAVVSNQFELTFAAP